MMFHGAVVIRALLIHGAINYMYTRPMGINMRGYGPYTLSGCRTAPITAVRRDNSVALGNIVL